jgi:hypothetical protein
MASTAPDYTNSRTSDSGKFARVEMIRASTLAERHRNLLVAMLHKNRFGDELWMSTESICVVMGRVCYRRKIAETDTRGHKLSSCEQISRRAVQRLIDEVVSLGVLTQLYGDNEVVPYGGGKKFRHTATYRLNPDKLAPRKTHDEYVEERDRARARNRQAHREESHREESHREHGDVTPIRKQPTAEPRPPAPAAPLPKHEEPAAEKLATAQPKMTKRECAKFVGDMATLMKGHTRHAEAHGGYAFDLDPGDPRYRPKLKWREALSEVCKSWNRTTESVVEALKFWGYQVEAP